MRQGRATKSILPVPAALYAGLLAMPATAQTGVATLNSCIASGEITSPRRLAP